MWGADTPLMIDALQIAALAAVVGAGAVFVTLRLRRKSSDGPMQPQPEKRTNLEERVQVLERIATDRSHDLADEIEQLRDNGKSKGNA